MGCWEKFSLNWAELQDVILSIFADNYIKSKKILSSDPWQHGRDLDGSQTQIRLGILWFALYFLIFNDSYLSFMVILIVLF